MALTAMKECAQVSRNTLQIFRPVFFMLILKGIPKRFGVVLNDYKLKLFILRHEDLKEMLDSNKDSLKLEAMKRIIGVSSSCIKRLKNHCCIL